MEALAAFSVLASLVTFVVSIVVLIVFFCMASNVSKIRRILEKMLQAGQQPGTTGIPGMGTPQ